jgi:hypothetical protein
MLVGGFCRNVCEHVDSAPCPARIPIKRIGIAGHPQRREGVKKTDA